MIPYEHAITEDSVFFDVSRFFRQAGEHVAKICNQMLSTYEMKFDVLLTDTLLCLSAEEYKYLPLWAGGDDDGTGGVFNEPIPVALAGPSGPGPDFHTGCSAAGSAVSGSELGDDDYEAVSLWAGSSSVNTSIAVDDGFSDNIGDRRRVVTADDEMRSEASSEAFSEDSTVYNEAQGKGKGRAVDRRGWGGAAAAGLVSSGLSETMGDMDMSDTATEVNPDREPPEVVEHTAFTADTVTDEFGIDCEIYWDSEGEENFDYGDNDEEMGNI
jgi:hypothetical protein